MRDGRTNARILFSLFKLTITQVVVAICIAAVLQVIELALTPVVAEWPIPDSANYVSWLSTIAQIGGVFIALYFTSVTAAAAAVYATVPNNVRDLLARERFGNVYIQYVTLITVLSLCLIALHLAGLEPIRIVVPLLILIAGVGVFAFIVLGLRAFDLFDPTRLAGSLFGDFGRWLDQVSAGGFRWRDRAFQNHAHRQANLVLESLRTLSDIAATHENLESAPLLEFSIRILLLLAEYQRRKSRIPTDSFWFEQKPEHKTWYMTEDTTTGMAHSTGTGLSPNSIPQYDWVEERLEPIPLKCFELNIGRKRLDNVRDLLGAVDTYIDALARNGSLRRGEALVTKMCDLWERVCSVAVSKSEGEQERAEEPGIANALCFLQLRILIAYRTALGDVGPERTVNSIRRLNWRRAESLYSKGFLAGELRQLEWIFPRMQMEVDVEGAIRTPVWYVNDLILKFQMESLIGHVDSLIERGTAFKQWSERLVKAGRIWQSAAILASYLEYLNKLAVHLQFFLRLFESLAAARHLTDLQWPELDKNRWVNRASDLRDELSRSLAQHIVLFSSSKKSPEDIPDYMGQFIDETGENLFNALLSKRVDEVRGLFAPYLVGTLGLFERMKPTNPKMDVWTEQKLQIAAAPILDVLELSGYAKLLAELHGEEQLWTGIVKFWDKLLQANPGMLARLAAITAVGMPRFQIPHRGFRRGEWSIRVQRKLDQLPRRSILHHGRGPIYTSEEVVHPSPLVRYCAKYSFHNGWEIFASLYLSKQPGGDGLKWGLTVREMDESLRREEDSYEGGDDEEPDDL